MEVRLQGKLINVHIRALGEQDIRFWESMRPQAGDWVTDLLSHCVRMEDGQEQPPAFFEELVISERIDLLLLICQASFGDAHYVTVSCPQCAEKMDIDYTIEELRPVRRTVSSMKIGAQSFSIKEPTGSQQRQWHLDRQDWQDDILRYCLGDSAVDTLTAGDKADALEKLLNCQPGTSLELAVNCIGCRHQLWVAISIATIFSRSMADLIETVEEEVHLLASSYHWSEADILALPVLRRKRYVERVSGQWI